LETSRDDSLESLRGDGRLDFHAPSNVLIPPNLEIGGFVPKIRSGSFRLNAEFREPGATTKRTLGIVLISIALLKRLDPGIRIWVREQFGMRVKLGLAVIDVLLKGDRVSIDGGSECGGWALTTATPRTVIAFTPTKRVHQEALIVPWHAVVTAALGTGPRNGPSQS
jgi:hypothetical protein